jgi:hypothetical protein
MARIESIPKPKCERPECDRTATTQVATDAGQVLGRYCSGHALGALRQVDERETPKRAASAPKEVAAR